MKLRLCIAGIGLVTLLVTDWCAMAVTNTFFNALQTATVVSTNMTATTIRSRGYLFTSTVDGWWSPFVGGAPTGRFQSVLWPNGIDAQTLTAGPSGPPATQGAATITIRRVDGKPFELRSFTGKLLGNTAGAGASFELMPQLNGNDAFADPLMYDATGYGGQSFTYTPMLSGYDTYILSLWMDYGLMQLTVAEDSVVEPPRLGVSRIASGRIQLTWPTNAADFSLIQATNSATSNWSVVTNLPVVAGTNYGVSLPSTNGNRFYRLVF